MKEERKVDRRLVRDILVTSMSVILFLIVLAPTCIPPLYDYDVKLIPVSGEGEGGRVIIEEDSSITYNREGLRINIRYMSDKELNARYPENSNQGEFSTNPFTYGNWVDPELGYTPNRFTVFLVSVHNPVLPKVELDPAKAVLWTDRGERLKYYGISREESENNFEEYYIYLRGPGGNERYRFEERMGIVKEELYRKDRKIFKGQDYHGYIVFAPLHDEVKEVELRIEDFVIRFDEFDLPIETIDLKFKFKRVVHKSLKSEVAS